MKIGTENNPIKLVNESIERPLLNKYSKLSSKDYFDFHALPDAGDDCFISNVIFNPHLTLPEVKVAVRLFQELGEEGRIFSTTFVDDYIPAWSYGDVYEIEDEFTYGIVIGRDYTLRGTKLPVDHNGIYQSLPSMISKMGFKLSPERLIKLLRRLHDFGYITITDISKYNTYDPPDSSHVKNTRARLRHIRLCHGMRRKDLSKRWIHKKSSKTVKSNPPLKTT